MNSMPRTLGSNVNAAAAPAPARLANPNAAAATDESAEAAAATSNQSTAASMRAQAYVQFREVAYGFQLFTYFAFHEQDVMQQDMAVKAYPCNNSLCVNPDHLFLCVERKRGKKNTNLCPLNSKGMACVNRSQEAMHAAGIAAKDEGMTDESLTAMTSFADYSRMSEQQLKAFHNTVYKPAKP